jgi:hypothetical protein
MLDVLCLDICMRSPPVGLSQQQVDPLGTIPTFDLQGSSCISGGILRGRALGNVFNNADADLSSGYAFEHRTGRVQIYTAQADPTIVKPDMELKHEVTPRLAKVLQVLARKYSPVRSMVFSSYLDILDFYMLFSQIKTAVFLCMKIQSGISGAVMRLQWMMMMMQSGCSMMEKMFCGFLL